MRIYIYSCANFTDLLTHNTTSGPFQKLGRLYESCLRQTINATIVHTQFHELGGYLAVHEVAPVSISPLLVQINKLGPMPLISLYFDLSYGKKPQSMLVVDSSLESSAVLQNTLRWMGPKSAPFDIRHEVPPLFDKVLELFLPENLALEHKFAERDKIIRFVREFNQLRRESFRKEFADSYVLYNVSSLTASYPFVSTINYYFSEECLSLECYFYNEHHLNIQKSLNTCLRLKSSFSSSFIAVKIS